jgi:hypothetical protein
MDFLKPVLIFLLKLVLNVALVAIGYFIYIKLARPVTPNTVAPDYFQEIIAVVMLMSIWPLLTMKQFGLIRNVGFGITCLLIPLVIFGIYSLNEKGSQHSYNRLFPIERTTKENGALILDTYIYERSAFVKFKVNDEPCLKLDSVEILIKDGLLGMKVVTDEVKFFRKPDCGS